MSMHEEFDVIEGSERGLPESCDEACRHCYLPHCGGSRRDDIYR